MYTNHIIIITASKGSCSMKWYITLGFWHGEWRSAVQVNQSGVSKQNLPLRFLWTKLCTFFTKTTCNHLRKRPTGYGGDATSHWMWSAIAALLHFSLLLLICCCYLSAASCCRLVNHSGLELCYTLHAASAERRFHFLCTNLQPKPSGVLGSFAQADSGT